MLLSCALLAACTSTRQRTITTVQPANTVRLALKSTEARACAERCTGPGADGDVTGAMACLEACPNSELKFGRCDSRDRLPDAICVAAPESSKTEEESGTCAERPSAPHVTCHDHSDHHADGRVVFWVLALLATVPLIAISNARQ